MIRNFRSFILGFLKLYPTPNTLGKSVKKQYFFPILPGFLDRAGPHFTESEASAVIKKNIEFILKISIHQYVLIFGIENIKMENNISSSEEATPLINQLDSDPNSDPNSVSDSVPNSSVSKAKTQNPCELCGVQYPPISSKSGWKRQKYSHLASPTHFKEKLENNFGALATNSIQSKICPFENCSSTTFRNRYEFLLHIGSKHELLDTWFNNELEKVIVGNEENIVPNQDISR